MSLIQVEPEEITFYFELGKKLESQIKIKNLVQNNVGVRLSPSSGRIGYNIEPIDILLQPLSSETVRITCSSLSSKPQSISDESFLIHCLLAPSCSVNAIDWFDSGSDDLKLIPVVFSDSKPAKEEYDELKSRYDKILEEKKIFEKKLKTSCKNLKESVRQELACLESKIRTSAEENSKLLNAMQENWKDEEGKHATEMESLKKRLEERLLTLETERKSKSNLEELVASLENDKKDAYARLKDAENDNSVLSNQKSDLESAVLSLRKENGSLQAKTAELQAKMDDALRPNVDALQKDKELHALKSTKLNNESTISKLEEILARKEAALARKEEELAEIKEALEQAQLTIMQMIEVQEKKQEEEINSELHFLTQSEQYHESQAESLSKENKMLLSLMQKIEIEDAHKFHFRSHILMLAEVASFKCDKCKIEGSGWAWQCQICDEMLHLKCNKI